MLIPESTLKLNIPIKGLSLKWIKLNPFTLFYLSSLILI